MFSLLHFCVNLRKGNEIAYLKWVSLLLFRSLALWFTQVGAQIARWLGFPFPSSRLGEELCLLAIHCSKHISSIFLL